MHCQLRRIHRSIVFASGQMIGGYIIMVTGRPAAACIHYSTLEVVEQRNTEHSHIAEYRSFIIRQRF